MAATETNLSLHLSKAERYLRAWDEKDLATIGEHLHPDVHFKGPMAELTGKEALLASTERIFRLLQSLKTRAVFSTGDKVAAFYDFNCIDPIGCCRTAELLTFRDGLIIETEIFYDARPFEKFMSQNGAQK